MTSGLQPCGTIAAARRHQRNPERFGPLCEACAQAIRDEKNGRVDARRAEDAAAAREAMPPPSAEVSRDAVLHEVLRTLRGQLAEAPPQSVASIAKQIRDTLDAMGDVAGESVSGGGVDDIAARRAERAARRRSAASG